jgi:hypothetical protein
MGLSNLSQINSKGIKGIKIIIFNLDLLEVVSGWSRANERNADPKNNAIIQTLGWTNEREDIP